MKRKHLIDWFPWDAFEDIQYLAKGGFATVFKAKLEIEYNYEKVEFVALKKMTNNVEFLNEVLFFLVYYLYTLLFTNIKVKEP